ncbi:MAG: efflux RND transporter periplasmic adaptor subunit [Gemmatimonadetes bacterium]|nr:efflux RND transporter periplasmic adaptor subunit [Gemmatimonadota bacterium]
MSGPVHDLGRLRIDRDRPGPAMARALKISIGIAVVAILLVVAVFFVLRRGGAVTVQVTRAEVTGAGGGAGITANGYVVARTKASVSSKIPGRLEYLGVTEGSRVRKGEIIARLEHEDYAAQVSQAEAELARARAALAEAETTRDQLQRDVARSQDLLARNLISGQQAETLASQLSAAEARVELQKAQVQSAEASLKVSRATLQNTDIRAPFDGTVLRKDAEVGEIVAPSVGGGLTRGAVVTMADLKTLEVEVDVNESYIAQIRGGQPARIMLDAYPDTSYRGSVRQIVPTADRQRATVLVKVGILQPDSRILPEMAARVEFLNEMSASGPGPALPSRIFVPGAAVHEEGGRSIVWVVRDGKARRQAVTAGPVSAGKREIRSGLSGGEQVVVAQSGTLEDGKKVTVAGP